MNTLEAIRTRRSTRKFRADMPDDSLLMQVIEAGRFAPSGGNSQSTHLIVIQSKPVLDKLAALVEQEFAKMEVTPGMYRSMANSINASHKGGYIFHYHAPVLILTANQKDYTNNLADCSCVLENMMIACNALDLGSCWINQLKWLNENDAVTAFLAKLGLQPDERVYGALAVGFPDTETGLPNRTPLNRTGNPVTFVRDTEDC